MRVYKFKCKDCGSKSYKKLDDHTYKCEYCGQIEEVFEEKQKETPKQEIVQTVKVQETQTEKPKEEPKKKKDISPLMDSIIYLAICFFLGEFGIHKFMKGRVGMGILYLFTFGLFGIGWLIDVIKGVVDVLKETANYFNN